MKIYQTLALGALAFEGKIRDNATKMNATKRNTTEKDATKYHEIETRTHQRGFLCK